jgi:hypothetical protein
MGSATHDRIRTADRTPAAPPAWAWAFPPRWVGDCGILTIGDTGYEVRETQHTHDNGMASRYWTLKKSDGTECVVGENADGDLSCDCQAATYRGECKHSRAVLLAFNQLYRREAVGAWLGCEAPAGAEF